MSKGLALHTIAAFIIAIIGVSVFLLLVSGNMQEAINTIYCKTYLWIANSIPFAETPTIPEICTPKKYLASERINERDNKVVSRILLALTISCWKQAEILRKEEDFGCYEVKISNKVENVTEANLSTVLIEEDHCKSIENSDYGCGVKNQIVWDVEGKILFLTKNIMAEVINNNTYPSEIPVNESMIPNLSSLTKKSELREYLKDEIPSKICWYFNSIGKSCSFTLKNNIVTFNITSKIYNYDIDLILSELEREGKIYSPINTQPVIFIKYDASREAVVIKG